MMKLKLIQSIITQIHSIMLEIRELMLNNIQEAKGELQRNYIKIKRPYGYIADSEIFIDGHISDTIPIMYNTVNINGFTVIDITRDCGFSIVANDNTKAVLIYGKVVSIRQDKYKIYILVTAPIQTINGVKGLSKAVYELKKDLTQSQVSIWPLLIGTYNVRLKQYETGYGIKDWKIHDVIETFEQLRFKG